MGYLEENGICSSSIDSLKELLKDRNNFADDQSYEIAKAVVSNYDLASKFDVIILRNQMDDWKED